MRHRIVVWTLCIGAVCALAWGGQELRRRQDAARLGERAEGWLAASLDRAPELERIEAARAAAVLDEALALHDPQRLRGLRAWARALDAAQKNRTGHARAALRRAVDMLGETADLLVLDALIARRAGELEQAGQRIERALAVAPKHARARLIAADLAIERGEAQDALTRLDALHAEHARLGTIENRRGVALESLGRTDEARSAYEHALVLGGADTDAHVNLGRVLRDRGQHAKAEQAFGRAIASDETRGEAWLGRGLCRIAQGDVAGGAFDLERARKLMPAESTPLIALADLDVHLGTVDRAIDRYRAALMLAPNDAVAWLKLGNARMRAGRHGEALEAFETAVLRDGQLAAAHNGLGAARMALGDANGAADALSIAAALDIADPNPLHNLALLHERQGHAREAREAREQALARAR